MSCVFHVVKLSAHTDREALRAAVADVFEHHSGLEATMPETDGVIYVVRLPHDPDPLEIVSCADVDAAAREWARHPVDIESERLARAAYFISSDGDNRFALKIHHLICDQISIGSVPGDAIP